MKKSWKESKDKDKTGLCNNVVRGFSNSKSVRIFLSALILMLNLASALLKKLMSNGGMANSLANGVRAKRARGTFLQSKKCRSSVSTDETVGRNRWFVKFSALTLVFTVLAIAMVMGGNVVVKDGELNVTDDLFVSTDVLFVNATSGNVGIGTTEPRQKLTIQNTQSGSVSSFLELNTNSVDDNSGAALDFRTTSGTTTDRYVARIAGIRKAGGGGSSELAFYTDNAISLNEAMRIDSTGNVGIGTTTPNEKLTVAGNVNITQNLTIAGMIKGDHKEELAVESIGDVEAGKGMVLYMKFNNDSGVGENYVNGTNSTVYDYSDAQNNGTTATNATNGGPQFTTSGMFNGAFEFDGVDDYIDASITLSGGTYSIMAWVKRDSTENRYIIDFRTATGTGYVYCGGTSVFPSSGTTYVDSTQTTTIPDDNEWHFVVVTGMTISASKAIIGARYTLIDNVQNGAIDQVAIYNRTLSAAEILENYKKGFKNIVEGSTLFDDETRVKDNLIVGGNLSVTAINPSGGNVGIGTTSPDNKLHIDVGAGGHIKLEYDTAGYFGLQFENGTDNRAYFIWDDTQAIPRFDFYAGGAAEGDRKMSIRSDGNIGIGTTSPEGKVEIIGKQTYTSGATNWSESRTKASLLVHGSSDVSGALSIGNVDDSAAHWIQASSATAAVDLILEPFGGNVGIGTTSPGSTLHVVGEINVSGVSGSGKVVCVKSDGAFGVCSDQPGGSGTCSCG